MLVPSPPGVYEVKSHFVPQLPLTSFLGPLLQDSWPHGRSCLFSKSNMPVLSVLQSISSGFSLSSYLLTYCQSLLLPCSPSGSEILVQKPQSWGWGSGAKSTFRYTGPGFNSQHSYGSHNLPNSGSGVQGCLLAPVGISYAYGAHTYMQTKQSYTQKETSLKKTSNVLGVAAWPASQAPYQALSASSFQWQ